MRDLTRDELLELTPDKYLSEGYLDEHGRARAEVRGEWATAAAQQLLAAQVSPQEVGFTVEAIKQLLPLHDEADPQDRLFATIEEATQVVARMIDQPLNEPFRQWLYACAGQVADAAEIDAFLQHIEAVNRQYGAIAALLTSL
jgi:hypothetical protein